MTCPNCGWDDYHKHGIDHQECANCGEIWKACKITGCTRPVGEQDRSDYRDRSFCSIQHDVKFEHLKSDARDAQEPREPDDLI